MNFKRKKARVNCFSKSKFKEPGPAWHLLLFDTRPKRRRDKKRLKSVMKGSDPDGIVWDLGNRKPHKYWT